jgi:hypothetical protein
MLQLSSRVTFSPMLRLRLASREQREIEEALSIVPPAYRVTVSAAEGDDASWAVKLFSGRHMAAVRIPPHAQRGQDLASLIRPLLPPPNGSTRPRPAERPGLLVTAMLARKSATEARAMAAEASARLKRVGRLVTQLVR